MRRLPPLNALRAFEAAARHLSFTKAADELSVTQAAVSHQVKALERRLNVQLFQRANRALTLAAAGNAYYPALKKVFDALHDATQQLVERKLRPTITVSVLPSFASKWLVPRLGRFRERNPEYDLLLAPSEELVDFARDNVDIGIRYGRGAYPGLHVERLLEEEIFPVCSPSLLDRTGAVKTPHDLRRVTLLHDDDHEGWRTWLTAAGETSIDLDRGPIFTDSGMLVQAAVEGQGVALARGAIAEHDLAAGRLVRLFDVTLVSEIAYYVVCPPTMVEVPKIAVFRAWLKDEADRYIAERLPGRRVGQFDPRLHGYDSRRPPESSRPAYSPMRKRAPRP